VSTNVPDSAFPETPKPLERLLDSPRLASRDKPRRPVIVRQVAQVRLLIRPDRRGLRLIPQYKIDEWANFYKEDESFEVLVRQHSFHGFELKGAIRLRIKRYLKLLNKWLKEWLKVNNCRATIERPPKKPEIRKKVKKEIEDVVEEPIPPEVTKMVEQAVEDSLDLAFDEPLSPN
jgi:hypothetical protein